jgi:hypothetical protein
MEKKYCITQAFITAMVIKDWHCRLASQNRSTRWGEYTQEKIFSEKGTHKLTKEDAR